MHKYLPINPYDRRRDSCIHMVDRKLHAQTAVPRLLITRRERYAGGLYGGGAGSRGSA